MMQVSDTHWTVEYYDGYRMEISGVGIKSHVPTLDNIKHVTARAHGRTVHCSLETGRFVVDGTPIRPPTMNMMIQRRALGFTRTHINFGRGQSLRTGGNMRRPFVGVGMQGKTPDGKHDLVCFMAIHNDGNVTLERKL